MSVTNPTAVFTTTPWQTSSQGTCTQNRPLCNRTDTLQELLQLILQREMIQKRAKLQRDSLQQGSITYNYCNLALRHLTGRLKKIACI